MKMMNIVTAALVGSGLLLSGFAPVDKPNTEISSAKVSNVSDVAESLSNGNEIVAQSSDAVNESVVFDVVSGQVGSVNGENAVGNLNKTKPHPGYKGKTVYVSGVTTRPVGVKTEVRVINILYTYNRTMKVQQYVSSKKKWVTVASKKTPKRNPNTSYALSTTINIPKFSTKSKGGTVSYRVNFPKTKTETAYTSKTFKVKYINPRFYTGYKKTLYNDMKSSSMCPNIIIYTKKSLSRNAAGRAWFGQYKIEAVTGLKGKYRKRVSVHECAHIKSGISYNEDISRLIKDSNKLFRLSKNSNKGIEYLADCMSFAKMGKSYIPGYKKSCSSYQISKAKRVWSGKKIY